MTYLKHLILRMRKMSEIRLSTLWASTFNRVHNWIKNNKFTHYVLSGGRASGKSSYLSLEIVQGLMRDSEANAIVYKKVAETISTSVYNQILWAIDELGVTNYWKATTSPYELTYIPTGQKILFRGLDKVEKTKGIKLKKGYFKYVWFEELTEFADAEEVETAVRSLVRGKGGHTAIFYTYNPPKSANSWVNVWAMEQRADKVVHHSTYLDCPVDWIGEQFIAEAMETKSKNELKYKWAYLGEVTGFGGAIFDNLVIRHILKEERKQFVKCRDGLDFGFSIDPTTYIVSSVVNNKLYLFKEFYSVGASFDTIASEIDIRNPMKRLVTADSAEPRSISELKDRGIKVTGAKKGQGSIEHGLKWLQDLDEIIIDSKRCPNAAREFAAYEYERDRHGNFKASYPTKDNHTIDAVRYGHEEDMVKKGKWGWK